MPYMEKKHFYMEKVVGKQSKTVVKFRLAK